MSQPIVVGVDGSGRSLRALLWAAHHAAAHQCPLRLIYVLPRWDGDFPFFPPGHFEEVEGYGRAALVEAVAVVRAAHPDIAVTTDMPMGTPAAVLRTEAENARSIVVGAEGADAGNLILGSTVVPLVGHAACPVVVVGHTSAGHGRVVVGTALPGGPRLRVPAGRDPRRPAQRGLRPRVAPGLAPSPAPPCAAGRREGGRTEGGDRDGIGGAARHVPGRDRRDRGPPHRPGAHAGRRFAQGRSPGAGLPRPWRLPRAGCWFGHPSPP